MIFGMPFHEIFVFKGRTIAGDALGPSVTALSYRDELLQRRYRTIKGNLTNVAELVIPRLILYKSKAKSMPNTVLAPSLCAESMKSRLLDLPTEILSRIFHIAVHSSNARFFKILATLLLVSHDVRDIVLHTPSLWTNLILNDSRPFDFAFTQLKRSKALPVDVRINVKCRNHKSLPCKEGYGILLKLLEALRESMTRWRTLDINLPSCWLAQEAMSACGPFLSHLEVLDVRTGHSDPGDFATPLPSVLLSMPQLRVLNFHWYSFRWAEGAYLPNILSISLTDYYMDDPNLSKELLEMIRSCPNLETLELDNLAERYPPSASQSPGVPPIVVPSLLYLSLRSCGVGKASFLFKNARFPNLTTCEVVSLGKVDTLLEVLVTHSSDMFGHCVRLKFTDCSFKEDSRSKLRSWLPSSGLLEFVDCHTPMTILLKK